ncbi:hypothetical protein AAMO2058_000992300 [Amorphochlora amoebiformis]
MGARRSSAGFAAIIAACLFCVMALASFGHTFSDAPVLGSPMMTKTGMHTRMGLARAGGCQGRTGLAVRAEEEASAEKKPPVFINKFKKPDSPVRIRLSRRGKHKAPFYRIVVQDSRRIPQGRFLENVGFYDPLRSTGKVSLNIERIKHWIGEGAKPTQTVARFLELVGIETK